MTTSLTIHRTDLRKSFSRRALISAQAVLLVETQMARLVELTFQILTREEVSRPLGLLTRQSLSRERRTTKSPFRYRPPYSREKRLSGERLVIRHSHGRFISRAMLQSK